MKHVESKNCPCQPETENYREPDPMLEILSTVAGVPCRFCFGHGNPDGACPECGNPKE